MSQPSLTLLRWLAVLPGALLGSVCATFALHWMLCMSLAHGETVSGVNTAPLEYAPYPFAIAVSFVTTGYEIAPTHKWRTALGLVGVWLATLVGLLIFIPLSQVHFGLRGLGALLGAAQVPRARLQLTAPYSRQEWRRAVAEPSGA